MRLTLTLACLLTLSLAASLFTILTPRTATAQDRAVAQIGAGNPLPVYVANPTVTLPEGFVPGSTWRYTTWTTPSVITWTARVEHVSGGWAQLNIAPDGAPRTTRWYYIPNMPGSWEK